MKFEFSFDDGHILDLKVAELLKEFGLTATFYIVCDWVGKENYLNWDDIKKLDKEGFEIGSHTMTHPQDLKKLYDDDLRYEIQTSKEMLETVLGHAVPKFCYPRGRYDERAVQLVAEAGYLEARTTIVHSFSSEDSLRKDTTLHIYNRKEYNKPSWAEEFLDLMAIYKKNNGQYFHIWGHSWEMEEHKDWGLFKQLLQTCRKKLDWEKRNYR